MIAGPVSATAWQVASLFLQEMVLRMTYSLG